MSPALSPDAQIKLGALATASDLPLEAALEEAIAAAFEARFGPGATLAIAGRTAERMGLEERLRRTKELLERYDRR